MVSFYAALLIALAGDPVAALVVPRAGVRRAHAARRSLARRARDDPDGRGILFGYYIVLPAALKFLTSYDSNLYNIQIRAKDYYSFVALVMLAVGIVFQVPLFLLGLVRIGVLTSRQAAQELAHRDRRDDCARRRAARRRPGDDAARDDPAAHALPRSRWRSPGSSSAAGTRDRNTAARPNDRRLGRLGAARRRAADRERLRPVRGRRSSRSGPAAATATSTTSVIVPGFVNAHSHLEYSRYAGFGDGQPFGPWIATHMARKHTPRRRGDARPRPAGRRRLAAPPASRRPPTTASRARPRQPRPSSACGRSSTSRSSPSTRPWRRSSSRGSAPSSTRRHSSGSGSRRTRPTRARSTSTGGASASGSRSAPTSPSRRRERLARARRRTARRERSRRCWSPPTGRRAVATLEPVLGPDLLCAHCVEVDAAGDRAARRPPACRSRTAHGRTPCSAAASRRSRTCAPPECTIGLGTDSPASTPSFDVFEEMRAGDLRRAGPRTAPRRAPRDRCSRPGDDRGGPRAANRRSGGYPDAREARRPDGRVARRKPLPSGGGSGGGRRLRRLARTSARDDRRRQDPLHEATDERTSGERYATPQAPPGAECSSRSRSSRAAQKQKPPQWQEELFFSRLRNHAKWAYVFARGRVRARLRPARRRLGLDGPLGHVPERVQLRLEQRHLDLAASSTRSTSSRRTPPPGATSRRPTRRSSAPQDAVNALERYTALRPKDANALSELASQYTTLCADVRDRLPDCPGRGSGRIARRRRSRRPSTTIFGKIFNDPNGLQDPIGSVCCRGGIDEGADGVLRAIRARVERRGRVQAAGEADARRTSPSSTSSGRRRQRPATTRVRSRAYAAFLKLSPNDVDAPQVKKLLKAGRSAQAAASASRSAGRLDSVAAGRESGQSAT